MLMKLIVGLGNPGEEYSNNRHNVGHLVADALLKRSLPLRGKRNLPKNLVVKKTSVFMNESGSEVKKLLGGLDPNNLYIIHDDLDIALGGYKIQNGKSPKDHKGLESIDEALGTSDYWHIRIGVDNRDPKNRTPGEEYVLQDFTGEEKKILEVVLKEICKKLATS